MTSSARENKFAVAAAIGFLVVFLFSITTKLPSFFHGAAETIVIVEKILNWIVYLSLAVTLFTKNKIAVLSAVGAAVILSLYYLVYYGFIRHESFFFNFADFLSFSALAVLIILSMMRSRSISWLWFIPGTLFAFFSTAGWVSSLITWLSRNNRFPENLSIYFSAVWKSMIINSLMTAALFLAGLWVKYSLSSAEAAPVRPAPVQPEPIIPEPVQPAPDPDSTVRLSGAPGDVAEQLKMFKGLFDAGVITQEEFEAKKKQLLDL